MQRIHRTLVLFGLFIREAKPDTVVVEALLIRLSHRSVIFRVIVTVTCLDRKLALDLKDMIVHVILIFRLLRSACLVLRPLARKKHLSHANFQVPVAWPVPVSLHNHVPHHEVLIVRHLSKLRPSVAVVVFFLLSKVRFRFFDCLQLLDVQQLLTVVKVDHDKPVLRLRLIGVEEDQHVELALDLPEPTLVHLFDEMALLLIQSDGVGLVEEDFLVDFLCVLSVDVGVVEQPDGEDESSVLRLPT